MSEPTSPVDRTSDRLLLQAAIKDIEAVRQVRAVVETISQISEKEHLTKQLANTEDSLQARREYFLWRTFPINSLPLEIFQRILRYTVHSITPGWTEPIQQRLYVTWVCRHWRNQALADPYLWTIVHFRREYPWALSLEFVRRAGNANMAITVSENKLSGELQHHAEEHWRLLSQLSPSASQIHHMAFHIRCLATVSNVFRFLRLSAFPHLHKLEIQYLPHQRRLSPALMSTRTDLPIVADEYFRDTELFAVEVPRLKILTLSNINLCACLPKCDNLTTIILENVYPTNDDFRKMLIATPRLRELNLRFAGPLENMAHARAPLQPVPLVHLATLHFNAYQAGPSWVQNLLDHFSAPNLLSLVIRVHFWQDCTPLADILRGRFPRLCTLRINGFHCPNTPEACARVTRWLDSMSVLKLAWLDEVPRHVLDCFTQLARRHLADAKSMGRTEAGVHSLHVAFLFDDQAGEDIVEFARQRRDLGVPLRVVGIDPRCLETSRVTREHVHLLSKLGVRVARGWKELLIQLVGEDRFNSLSRIYC